MTTTQIKYRPIIFNAEMIRALQDERKTMTRRVVKDVEWATDCLKLENGQWEFSKDLHADSFLDCPYGIPGDHLWVRETWCHKWNDDGPVFNDEGNCDKSCIHYKADGDEVIAMDDECSPKYNKDGRSSSPWKPSIHMPRWASRFDLENADVRVERVQDISPRDCSREGIVGRKVDRYLTNTQINENVVVDFAVLWDSINAKKGFGWDVNPLVWVIEFKRIEQ